MKLYDSMAKIEFIKDKLGTGMYAKDGEYVEFDGNCECSGQVKNYNKSQLIFSINQKLFTIIRSKNG